MSLYGTNKFKAFYGTEKVKAIMYGTQKVWSGASEVTRYVQGEAMSVIEVEEGIDIVKHMVAPSMPNATFVGWATESGSIETVDSLIANGDPISIYAVYDYAVISDGAVVNSSFIQSTTSSRLQGYSTDPYIYGGAWKGQYVSWSDAQGGTFSANFVLATKAIGMKCTCDLYAKVSGRNNYVARATASISNVGTYNGAWQADSHFNPEFVVADNTRTFSFSGEFRGSSPTWMPLSEAGCVSLTLRGN